jgi:hypothetical protein
MSIRRYLIVLAILLSAAAAWRSVTGLRPTPRVMAVPAADDLSPFVHSRPAVPVVFTSRTEPESFRAEAPYAEGYTFPGSIPWAAREGRLRLLDVDGKVYELTWGRMLPDGGTLVDVMSPSVSLDGSRILFAGRKAVPDPGRWRIYSVDVDGRNLSPLTGGPGDQGCVAVPPLRYAADGSILPDEDRRRVDFDDVDPADLGPDGFAFASSRIPDLGRDHSRRSTQIWSWLPGEDAPVPMTANRNNDRWPVLATGNRILFSLWSRNREAVTADWSDVRPVAAGGSFATRPTDRWMAARIAPGGADFGYAVKSIEPVWRPRPLFNGRVAFMTPVPGTEGRTRIAQADWGYIRSSPSSLEPGADLPDTGGAKLLFGPATDGDGNEWSAGCPSPCPDGSVLFSAGTVQSGLGIYICPDDWSGRVPASRRLFDDPRFVDAEPVAVYPRFILRPEGPPPSSPLTTNSRPERLLLPDGREYTGPSGYLENLAVRDAIRSPIPWTPPGEGRTDPRRDPLIPPPKGVRSVAVFASYRDRFDDPARPRIPGGWGKVATVPVDEYGALRAWVPADPRVPTLLCGLDGDGKIVRWTGRARDSAGRPGVYYALAGDHYSPVRVGGYHYCNGCHTGHSFVSVDVRERAR